MHASVDGADAYHALSGSPRHVFANQRRAPHFKGLACDPWRADVPLFRNAEPLWQRGRVSQLDADPLRLQYHSRTSDGESNALPLEIQLERLPFEASRGVKKTERDSANASHA